MSDPTGTPAPTPARGRGLHGLASRAVEDAQLARPVTALVSLALLCLMIVGGSLMPVPYVIEQPGPAIDVLGEYREQEIVVIDGVETYPTDGALMMTTVSVDGGPGYTVTPVDVLVSWFDRSRAVLPRELMFPPDQTREQTTLNNSVQMSTSQQGAVAVALDELDIDYEPVVMIAGVQAGAPAEGHLEPGDVLVGIDGQTATDVAGYQALVQGAEDGGTLPITVRRDGQETELQVPTEVVDGTSRLGVVLATGYEFPMDVQIAVGDIGGPSAGMIFSLSVYDELTPGALTGGHAIAGTGTIAADGTVGPIGGIRQKMVGAREADAGFFLAPRENCDQVIGYEPEGLEVVAVGTFDEALTATETIAATGGTDGLPTCEEQ